ncbi:MAG: S-layer protein [Methanomicrobiales archaeon]|nr:S-layer protein [Methanomicrobiales archaeon]
MARTTCRSPCARWGRWHSGAAILLLLVLVSLTPAHAVSPMVIVSSSNVNPRVLMPGDQGLITVTLTNTATGATLTETSTYGSLGTTVSSVTDVSAMVDNVFLNGKGDIQVLAGNAQFSGPLGPGQSVNLTFLIQAPGKSGVFFPVLHVSVENADPLFYPIPVFVNLDVGTQKRPALVLSQERPGYLPPGETGEMALTIRNDGESAASDITLRVERDGGGIAPTGGGAIHFSRLGVGENVTFPLHLLAGTQAAPGIHDVAVGIGYTMLDGSRRTEQAMVTVDVRGKADLAVSSLKTTPAAIGKGDHVELVVRVENAGTGSAKSTSASLEIPLPGSTKVFIGTIKPGNDAPAVFNLEADRSGEIPGILNITYRDDFGTRSLEEPVTLRVGESDAAAIALVAVLVLAAAGLGAWYLISRRRNRGDA